MSVIWWARSGQQCRSSRPSAWILSVCVGFVSGVWNWKSQVWLISFELLFQSACALAERRSRLRERERDCDGVSLFLWAGLAEVGCCEKKQASGEVMGRGGSETRVSTKHYKNYPMLHCMINQAGKIWDRKLKRKHTGHFLPGHYLCFYRFL